MAEFTAFLSDADSRRVVREAAEQATVRRGTVRHAVQACQTEESADLLLVDLDGEQNPLAHMALLLQVCRPQTVILATGSENSVALANDLYRGGVFLYIPKPLDTSDLRRGMLEVEAAHDEEPRPEIQTSRLVLVLGKGMGANTVTALLARLAAERGRYVSCVDLDPNFGTLSLAFDTQPERGLAQTLQNPGGGFDIERLQARVSDRLGLIAHSYDQSGEPSGEEGLLGLVEALSTHAHMILACGASLAQVETLRHLATNHLIVFEPTPAGVSIAARWLRILEGATSTLIMNHARALPSLLGDEQLRTSLGDRTPDVEIPYLRNMARAMALGEPERAVSRRERELFDRILNPLVGLASGEES
ncbi:MAG: hypothetical protein F4029_09365 [Gammaproteobacteria bacterium]|nr:hypothetical protein [Gammaproteobacteria bacterium]MYF27270.1 hypothetical protein [Gammaproteobacteria bacterium]MYK46425.1 hypothetical protein [Gammaproteobacteria bacterium]